MSSSEIRIKQIIHHLPDAIVVADTQGVIRYLNPAASQLLGHDLTSAAGQPLADIVTLVDEKTEEALTNPGLVALSSGLEENGGSNALLIGRDGLSELPVEVLARPLQASDGSINGVLISIHDVRLARFKRRQLTWNASHDPLTGLFNKAEFDRQCEELILTAQRDQAQHALLLLDIDHFRQLNELGHHQSGDELLIQVAEHCRSLVRATDMVTRSGADEFLILLPHCQPETAERIAEHLRSHLENLTIDLPTGPWPVSVSIGITRIHASGSDTVAALIHEAESANFAAKENGRNQWQRFDDAAQRYYNERLHALQEAIQQGHFRLYYQLIQPMQGADVLCEILLRQLLPDGSEAEPADFLPLAEKSGLIVQLDAWVIRQVLDLLFINPLLRERFGSLHINLSAYSFASQTFLDEITALLSNHDLSPGQLCFEVSESSIHHNLGHTQHFMAVLSGLGCRFAVDDVDADLTAFEQLTTLPLDMVKIEGSLVQRLQQSASAPVLIKAIAELADKSGMQAVAQHVEDYGIYEWLQTQGLAYAQGYALHQPQPLEDLL